MFFYEILYEERSKNFVMSDSHKHDTHFELFCLTEGTLQAVLNDCFLNVTAPAIVVIPPGAEHKNSSGPVKRYLINVSPDCLSSYVLDSLFQLSKSAIILPIRAISLLEEMFALEQGDDLHSKQKQLLILNYIVYLLLNQQAADCVPISLNKPDKKFVIAKIIYYIEHNYQKKISYDELSREFAICSSSLTMHFKSVTGKTIGEYILQVRLNNAKNLLAWSNKGIDEIAVLTGFCNASYFTKRFLKEVGMTPLQYRIHRRK